jgi:hypothetical protein
MFLESANGEFLSITHICKIYSDPGGRVIAAMIDGREHLLVYGEATRKPMEPIDLEHTLVTVRLRARRAFEGMGRVDAMGRVVARAQKVPPKAAAARRAAARSETQGQGGELMV